MEQLTLNFGRGRFVCKLWTFHTHAHKCNRFKAHFFTIYGEAKKWFEKRFTAMSSSSSNNNDAHILHMFLWINMNALNISCHCFYEYFVTVFRGYWFLFFMMWLYVACVYSLNIFWLCVCSASFLVTHEIQFADALGRKWAHTLKAIWIHTHKLVVMELMSLLSLSVSRSAPLFRFKYQPFFLHWNWIFFVLSVHFTMYSALFSIVIRGERKTSKIVSHTWKWKALVKHAPEYIPHSYRKTK